MTIGTVTCLPSAKFATPRSYIYELCIARYGDSINQAANVWTIHAVPPDSTFVKLIMRPNYYLWSSNRGTLDFVFDEAYVDIGGVPPHVPFSFTLSYGESPLTQRPALILDWFSGSPDYQAFPLPPQPPNYWLPKPL